MAQIPPAPTLPGEALIEIFVHPAALPPERPLEEDNKFSDARRLEYLGGKMSELVYMDMLRARWPRATAPQLTPSRKNNPPLSRPSLNTSMAIPSAPELPGEAYLEVFIHPDGPYHVNTAEPASKFRNTRDLERLGRTMVEMAYMHIMYSRWPNVTGDQLNTLTNATINGVMERAVRAYRWKEQIRGCPPHIDLMQSSEEAYRIFRTYAGAVHVQHGYDELRNWIEALTAI
ncbi:uncharacterized protein TRAVEDRAFT_52995 [Trametes versicolor FP-101664 SS1]|uniref:uncharacterized protein n=1 Tax=Trametes versicolor (strain FP-101664) TaxID=717944 RepID=UPI0004621594|nr:uncharacterized protein TRAVEDRAFT_52995 [Trametes versicolor FP-101664 SS1]EIW52552.1 hypothetical protein TRAVEDRAFT_52995 [Trametes versicolor FP-101664 SS1]